MLRIDVGSSDLENTEESLSSTPRSELDARMVRQFEKEFGHAEDDKSAADAETAAQRQHHTEIMLALRQQADASLLMQQEMVRMRQADNHMQLEMRQSEREFQQSMREADRRVQLQLMYMLHSQNAMLARVLGCVPSAPSSCQCASIAAGSDECGKGGDCNVA